MVIDEDAEESSLNMLTKMTTSNIQIETGVMILMISSPNESMRLLGFVFWSIWGSNQDWSGLGVNELMGS